MVFKGDQVATINVSDLAAWQAQGWLDKKPEPEAKPESEAPPNKSKRK
jgi:hypothetical protein